MRMPSTTGQHGPSSSAQGTQTLCFTPQVLAELYTVVTTPRRVTEPKSPEAVLDAIATTLANGMNKLYTFNRPDSEPFAELEVLTPVGPYSLLSALGLSTWSLSSPSSGYTSLLKDSEKFLAAFGANQIALAVSHGQADAGVPLHREGLQPTPAVAPAPTAKVPKRSIRADLGMRDIPERNPLLKHREPPESDSQVFATDGGLKPEEQDEDTKQDDEHASHEPIHPAGEVLHVVKRPFHHSPPSSHVTTTPQVSRPPTPGDGLADFFAGPPPLRLSSRTGQRAHGPRESHASKASEMSRRSGVLLPVPGPIPRHVSKTPGVVAPHARLDARG
jgi:hypothetical protein